MSTTYTPNQTNVQAPAAAPDPDNLPLETLPADGDALNAASVAQAFKVLGDYIAWLKAPRGVVSSLVQALRNYRNARGNRVSGIDHFGAPGGRLRPITEDWLDAAAVQISVATSGNWFGKWKYGVFNGGGIGHVYANGPTGNLASSPWGAVCGVDYNGATGFPAATVVESAKPWFFMSDDLLIYEADFSVSNGTLAASTHAGLGLGDGTLVSSASRDPLNSGTAIPAAGVFLYRIPSGTNWIAQTLPPGGGGSSTNTGIAVVENATHNYKVVIVGSGASDDGTARVLHYIDGALVANHVANMNGAFLFPFHRIGGTSVDATVFEVSALKVTPKLSLGDTPI